MAGAGGFEPPHGGIKSLRYLPKIKDLAALTTSMAPEKIKDLRAICLISRNCPRRAPLSHPGQKPPQGAFADIQTSLRRGRRAGRAASAPAEMARISQLGRTRFSGSADDLGGFWIGGRGGFVSGLGRTPPPGLRLLEPVALAVQLQNMDMVGQAIEQRTGQALIPEDARPFLERQIRRNDSRAAFMTLAEDRSRRAIPRRFGKAAHNRVRRR